MASAMANSCGLAEQMRFRGRGCAAECDIARQRPAQRDVSCFQPLEPSMSNSAKRELEDKADKLRSARTAAKAPDASDRDRADLKLIEQDFIAQKRKTERQSRRGSDPHAHPKPASNATEKMDQKLDAALKDSFPGSDPVSFLEAAPAKKSVKK